MIIPMKKILLFITLIMLPIVGFAQKKVYVFKPESSEFAPTTLLAGKTIQINYQDARIIHKKNKINATFEEITSVISESLKSAFPKCSFVDSDADIILNIRLEQYEVYFPGGVWRGFAKYQVELVDGTNEIKQEILGTRTQGNIWGIKTAKNVLQTSFDRANEDLVKLLMDHLE